MSLNNIQDASAFAPWSLMAPEKATQPIRPEAIFQNSPTKSKKQPIPDQHSSFDQELKTVEQAKATKQPTTTASDTDDSLGFFDIIDAINPLQHIPGVSSVYRDLTGDEISPAARIAGGSIYGGIIGFFSSVTNAIVEKETGQDIGEHVIGAIKNNQDKAPIQHASSPENRDPLQTADFQRKPLEESLPNNLNSQPTIPVENSPAKQTSQTLENSRQAAISENLTSPLNQGFFAAASDSASNTIKAKSVIDEKITLKSVGKDTIQTAELTPPPIFQPLSKDVQRQLERIRSLKSGNNSVLQAQELTTAEKQPQPKQRLDTPTQEVNKAVSLTTKKPATNPYAAAAIANQPVDISEAMMKALEKYENLVNKK